MNCEYAKVYLIDDIPYAIDREYDYYIPAQLRPGVIRGAFVTLPFGRGNRRHLALVTRLCDHPDTDGRIKPIDSVCPDSMSLDDELLGLCVFIKEQTLCRVGDVVHSMIPAAAMSRLVEYYMPIENPQAAAREFDADLLDWIFERKKVTEAALIARFGEGAGASVRRLIDAGLISRGVDIREGGREFFREYCSLAMPREEAEAAVAKKPGSAPLRSEMQRRLVSELLNAPELSFEELSERTGATRQQIRTLADRGIIEIRRERHTAALRPPTK